jgi:TRAP-type mannitol/chloroaromatic compound transport system permease small subunit
MLDAWRRRSGGDQFLHRSITRFIDTVDAASKRLSQLAAWLVMLACAVSAVNAIVRYTFSIGSNAFLELQWYLFAGTLYFAAPYLLKLNEHVRVDVLYGGRSGTTKAWIDLLGLIFFFMPVCVAMVFLSLNFVHDSYVQNEMSVSSGGLLRWPVKVMIPIGFALLSIQGVSEILKRIGFLSGTYNMDTHYERPLQ